MKIKKEKVYELMETYFGGKYYRFAKALRVDPGHFHRSMKQEEYKGTRIIGAIMRFCKENGLDVNEYIDFEPDAEFDAGKPVKQKPFEYIRAEINYSPQGNKIYRVWFNHEGVKKFAIIKANTSRDAGTIVEEALEGAKATQVRLIEK